MLASFRASMLNQKSSDLGILNRFRLDPSRSRERPRRGLACGAGCITMRPNQQARVTGKNMQCIESIVIAF
jgi:hypothetical protein